MKKITAILEAIDPEIIFPVIILSSILIAPIIFFIKHF